MKTSLPIAVLILLVALAACRSRTPQAGDVPLATLQPLPEKLEITQSGRGGLQFILKNTSTNEISYIGSLPNAGLMTTDGSGKLAALDEDATMFPFFTYSGASPDWKTLSPGESTSVQSIFQTVKNAGKIFGELPVSINGTNWIFMVQSAPFEITADLTKPTTEASAKKPLLAMAGDAPPPPAPAPAGVESFVKLQPDLRNGTLNQGAGGELPFVLTNTSTNELTYVMSVDPVHLMTTGTSGRPVTLYEFQNPNVRHGGFSYEGIGPRRLNLKPGESTKLHANLSMYTLAYVAGKGRKVFGQLPIAIAGTSWVFMAQSEPFEIPAGLVGRPWEDLGKQPYLTVTVDETKRRLSSPVQGNRSRLYYRVNITNTSSQTIVVNFEHVSFLKSETDPKDSPNLWEAFAGVGPIPGPWNPKFPGTKVLKPGESVHEGQESYITVWINTPATHWHTGDTVVAGVAARIEGTDKAFESFSAPFKFPDISQMPVNNVPFDNPQYIQK